MEQVITIIQCIAVLGLFLAMGFAAVKTKYIKKEAAASLSGLATRFMFPAWILSKLLSEEVTKEQIIQKLPIFVAGMLITLVLLGLGILVAVATKAPDKQKYVLIPLFSAPNAIFLAMPICQGLFGDSGVLDCTVFSLGSDMISWTITISIMAAGSAKSRAKRAKAAYISAPRRSFSSSRLSSKC